MQCWCKVKNRDPSLFSCCMKAVRFGRFGGRSRLISRNCFQYKPLPFTMDVPGDWHYCPAATKPHQNATQIPLDPCLGQVATHTSARNRKIPTMFLRESAMQTSPTWIRPLSVASAGAEKVGLDRSPDLCACYSQRRDEIQ